MSGSWKKNRVPVEGKEHEYAYEGSLPSDFQPYIVTPAIDGKGTEITFGWDGSQTIGGRWRYDYISMKFFGQAGWGAEYGTVTLTAEAQKYLGAPGNIELASGVQLEKGATYVMTVTNCTILNSDNKFDCTVDFKKL